MVAAILIIGVSLVLFGYWFRYSCLLILRADALADQLSLVAEASNLSIVSVLGQLDSGVPAGEIDGVRTALVRDYRIVSNLMNRVPDLDSHVNSVEQFMLKMDFALMSGWSMVSRPFAPSVASESLQEMAGIVSFFANAAASAGVLSARS
jgi:hypothetical protein